VFSLRHDLKVYAKCSKEYLSNDDNMHKKMITRSQIIRYCILGSTIKLEEQKLLL